MEYKYKSNQVEYIEQAIMVFSVFGKLRNTLLNTIFLFQIFSSYQDFLTKVLSTLTKFIEMLTKHLERLSNIHI